MDFECTRKKKEAWEHPQFPIGIAKKYPDGAYKTIRMTAKDLPGVQMVDAQGKIEILYEHRFHFDLPREYPQNLGKIKIVNETPLFHPRIVSVGTNACYTVNGEVDRILTDIIFNILLRPETVRPPNKFKDADWGLDSQKMRWYIQYGPDKIYEYLRKEWGKRQKTKKIEKVEGKKVQFLD